jgi:hypothetical protein
MRKIGKLTSILLCLLMVAVVFAMPVNVIATDSVPDGMVSYWRLDEGSGDVAGDSADGNDGYIHPSQSTSPGPEWTNGQVGGALDFDGVDDHVSAPTEGFPTGGSDRTIEFWMKSPNMAVGNMFIAGWGSYGGNKNSAIFMGWGNYPTRRLAFWGYGNDLQSTSTLADNVWYHIAFTLEGTTATLYLNGVVDSTNTLSGLDTPSDTSFYMGRSIELEEIFDLGTQINAFNGAIDEMTIHDRALSAIEIQTHYNLGLGGNEITPDSNTVGLLHLDDGTGTTAMDSSSRNNHGILYGYIISGPMWTTGQVGGALEFDGADDHVVVSSPSNLPLGNDARTIELWAKVDSFAHDTVLVTWGYYGGQRMSAIALKGYSAFFFWGYGADVNGYGGKQPGIWYHVAFTFDGSVGKLYVNGALESSATLPLNTVSSDLYMGKGQWGGGYYNGLIDEVAIWNKALTATEIQNHYLGGLEGKGYFTDPTEAIQDLFNDIQNLEELPDGAETSLLSKLNSALEAIDNGNENAAINILNAFINMVAAQSGKKLTVEEADQLIAAAEDILDTIVT